MTIAIDWGVKNKNKTNQNMAFPCHTHILLANSGHPDGVHCIHCLSGLHEKIIDLNGLQYNRSWL